MRPGPHELTVRQAEVLSFIRDSIAANGYPPTHSEICGHFGWRRTGSNDHVRALMRKGCLARGGDVAGRGRNPTRTLRLVSPPEGPVRVDLASGTVGTEPSGVRGVAYRMTAVTA